MRGRWLRSTKKGNQVKVLADSPNVDGSKSENRSQPESLPVRRIGLEQELFLVDRSGVLRASRTPSCGGAGNWHER